MCLARDSSDTRVGFGTRVGSGTRVDFDTLLTRVTVRFIPPALCRPTSMCAFVSLFTMHNNKKIIEEKYKEKRCLCTAYNMLLFQAKCFYKLKS